MSLSHDEVPGIVEAESSCAKCGVPVDPLRAARARIFGNQLLHFCSSGCAESFSLDDLGLDSEQRVDETGTPPAVGSTPSEATEQHHPQEVENADSNPRRALVQPSSSASGTARQPGRNRRRAAPEAEPTLVSAPHGQPRSVPTENENRLPALAVACGALSISLLLASQSNLTLYLRAGLTSVGTIALALVCRRLRTATPLARVLTWAPTAAASVIAFVAALTGREEVSSALGFAAAGLIASGAGLALLEQFGRPIERRRVAIEQLLNQPASLLDGSRVRPTNAADLRPGMEIVLHAGETVPADVTVTAGTAEVFPWPEAQRVEVVGEDRSLNAGARLASGQLRATVRWTHNDRQWARLTLNPALRVDRVAPIVLLAEKVSGRGAVLAPLSCGVVALVANWTLLDALIRAAALAWVFGNPLLTSLPALVFMRTHLRALANGIAFRSAAILDVAGRISTAVFCARGTLLLDEPELSSIEAFGKLDQDAVLELVAGVQRGERTPIAVALARAARARGVVADAVRSPTHRPGLGTTAVSSSGESLVVGNRALMLEERISIALAENLITELEAMGRSALLVALSGHLVGILAFQDGLRAGARAAVQRLLDAGIEPVLISGDARKTCEALGTTIDVDHVRPEVLPADRGLEVERLQSGGASVAVVGRTPIDDLALEAATLSIVLPSPGFRASDFDVELADRDVQKAAVALALAHKGRTAAYLAFYTLGAGSGLATLFLVALSAPPVTVPAISLLTTLLASALVFGPRDSRAS